jgi:PBP1b-binding outer membrane lipoprotein LpoB
MKSIFIGIAIITCFISACNSKTGTTANSTDSTAIKTEQNKQTALASVHAFEKMDTAVIKRYCAADFVEYGNGEHPPMKNIDSVIAYMQSYLTAFPDSKVDSLQAFAAGDTIVITDV